MKLLIILISIFCFSCNSSQDEELNWDKSIDRSPDIPTLEKMYPGKVYTIEWVEKDNRITSIALRKAKGESEIKYKSVNDLINNLSKLEKGTSISYIFPCVRQGLTNKELNIIMKTCKNNSLLFHLHPGG